MTNLYREEILDGATLPIKHVAFTACFRREQMAAGRDTRGIKRGHQFDKVELVKFVRPETLDGRATALLDDAEDVLHGARAAVPRGRRCAPATCRSRRWRSSTSRSGRRAATSGSRSAPARTSATSRRAARASASGPRRQGEAPLRAHAQRLGPGAAAHADRGARDLPARRRQARRAGGAAAVLWRRNRPR